LSKAQGHPKIPSNSGGLVEGAEGGGARVTEERGFFKWPEVKSMSSLPWVSVNYFLPLTIEENTETKSMPDHPQEVEEVDMKEEDERAEAGDDEQPTEGTADGCCG